MAMGFCTSGSAANSVALKPGGRCIIPMVFSGGVRGMLVISWLLVGVGKSARRDVNKPRARMRGRRWDMAGRENYKLQNTKHKINRGMECWDKTCVLANL